MQISDDEFDELVSEAIAAVPEPYKSRMQNIAFLIEDQPSMEQRQRSNLSAYQTLLGLYEGVPLPQRGGTTKLLPDKITLFKQPLLATATDKVALKRSIAKTVWHEVAHYFGLDHKRINELEGKS
jgi:predicted Zn-dependent protease with MMP-like domain